MNNYLLDLRQKIKARNNYRVDYLKLVKKSNRIGFFSSLGCLFLGVSSTIVVAMLILGSSAASVAVLYLFLTLPCFFLTAIPFCTLAFSDKKFSYSPFDFFNACTSVFYLSDRFWKREKRLNDFNSYEDASTFFENCEPLDESSVVNLLKSIYEFSLEETDLFKECLVYREELGFWPKFLLKMAVEIDKVRLAAVRSEISSLEGLNSNFKGVELDSMAKGKIKIESKVTSVNLRNIQNQALG